MDKLEVKVEFHGAGGWRVYVDGNQVASRRYKYAIREDLAIVVRSLRAAGERDVVILGSEPLNVQLF